MSFDPGSFQMIQELGAEEFIGLTNDLSFDILFPNAEEGEVLTGEREPGRVAAALAERYPGATIALKLDAEGAYLLEPGAVKGVHLPPYPGRLVDATGAGDAFAGAFLAARWRGAEATEAARWANRVSAWVIERIGARPSPDAALAALLAELPGSAGPGVPRRRSTDQR